MGFLNTAHLRFLFDGLLWTVGLSLLAFLGGGLLGRLGRSLGRQGQGRAANQDPRRP